MPILLLVILALTLAGCGRDESPTPRLPTRTPMPTFTPTPFVVNAQGVPVAVAPAAPAAQDAPVQDGTTQDGQAAPGEVAAQPVAEAPTSVPASPTPEVARAVVTSPQINVRTGPSTDYALAGQVNRGEELTIVGRNDAGDWFQVCCVGGQTVWVAAWLVDTVGPVESVGVVANLAPPPPTNTPVPAAPTNTPAPAEPTPTSAPAYLFTQYGNLLPRQSSNQVITFWGGLFNSNLDGAVGGYILVAEGPAGRTEVTFDTGFRNGDPGLESEFIYNAKAEFMGATPGVYSVWVADPGGNQVSEAYQYTVEGNNRTFLPRWRQN